MAIATVSVLTIALFYAPNLFHLTYFTVPLSAQAKLYSTTMLAVLNSRMKLGVMSESASSWRDHELTLPDFADRSDIRFNFASLAGPSQSIGVFVVKDEVVTTDEPKVQSLFVESL